MVATASRLTGVVFLAVTALGFVGYLLIPASESPSDPGPGGYPLFVLALMALCAVGLLVQPGSAAVPEDDGIERSRLRVAYVLIALAVYAGIVGFVGFIIPTALLTAVLLWLAGKRGPIVLATYPIVLSLLLFYVFNVYLAVALPRGPLEGLIS